MAHYTETDIHLPTVKKEYSEEADKIDHTAGQNNYKNFHHLKKQLTHSVIGYTCSKHLLLVLPNPGTVTVKMEPRNGEGCGGEMEHTVIYIEVPAVKKECLENTERCVHTPGKHTV